MMFCIEKNIKLLVITRRTLTWSYTRRRESLKGNCTGCLNGTFKLYSRSNSTTTSVRIPSETIQQCLSDHNKQKIIERLNTMKGNKLSGLEEAAVLVPFCIVDNKPSLLFTLRSSSLVSHRGQVR